MTRFLLLDCDSTLSGIEGVDELAGLRGPGTLRDCEAMTNAAMDGAIPIGEIFARRLDLIRPDRAMCQRVAGLYLERLAPHLTETLNALRAGGWTPIIVSGGFTQVIRPLADRLDISRVFAVDLRFDAAGAYAGFDTGAPTARNGGKPDVVRLLKKETPGAVIAMVGDGVSDMECLGVAERFIGFGGFVERPKVKAGATHFIRDFRELPGALAGL